MSLVDFDIQSDHYQYSFDLSAEIKEHGTGGRVNGENASAQISCRHYADDGLWCVCLSLKTGVTLTGNGETTLTRIIRTVTFEETLEWYKPGIPFEGKVNQSHQQRCVLGTKKEKSSLFLVLLYCVILYPVEVQRVYYQEIRQQFVQPRRNFGFFGLITHFFPLQTQNIPTSHIKDAVNIVRKKITQTYY